MIKTIKHAVLVAMLLPGLALAAPKVVLDLKAEKEVVVEENGKQVVKRVPADKVETGKPVFYTLSYKNEGDAPAANVEIRNKIPENTVYVLDSAWGEGTDIQFSIDKGKTFKKPSLLVYEVKGPDGKAAKKQATPDSYTDILWVVKEIPAGKSGQVGFTAKVN